MIDSNQIQERNRLDYLVRKGLLYCNKHQRIIRVGEFWSKRCYISRTGSHCDYISLRREGGADSIESSVLSNQNVRRCE